MIRMANKQAIRRAFNAATETYDAAADWQKNVASILLNYMDEIQPHHNVILDLGAGISYLTKHIQQRYPENQFIALDIAESMLFFSKQSLNRAWLVCSDAENLPLKNECVDIIVSNMMLHWCHSLERTLKEQYQILTQEGLFIFSVLGPQSLQSLRTAWNKIDNYSHVNHFPALEIIQQACRAIGFNLLRFERHDIKKHYETVYELMNHLKATGAKNTSDNKPKGLMGKQKIQQLSKQYQNPLHYEIFTMVCQK